MADQLPVLIVVFPLIGALCAVAAARIREWVAFPVATAGLAASFVCAIVSVPRVLHGGRISYHLGSWMPPVGIEYVLDPLSAGMAVVVTFIALAVAFYAWPILERDYRGRIVYLYSLFGLLVSGLLGMVITADAFNLYVHLEIASLAVYALIAAGGDRASVAAFRYVILGTLGGTFYLLGVGYLYMVTGSLNMADIAVQLAHIPGSRGVVLAIALIATGLGIKMALFPMHGWMPDAYTYSPSALTAFIAGVMGKVAAFALLRILYFVLYTTVGVEPTLQLLGVLACAAILGGSVMAIAQSDLRRMLAYSSVAQIGYIVLGMSMANEAGLIGALLHIVNHAAMKACLFLVAGGIGFKMGTTRIAEMVKAGKVLPLSMAAFVIAALSMVGLPPTAGFFSKLYLVKGALAADQWPYIVVIIASSLLNAVYFFRILERVYVRKYEADEVPARWGRELPVYMLAPIVIFGVSILALGLFSERIVTRIIQTGLPGGL